MKNVAKILKKYKFSIIIYLTIVLLASSGGVLAIGSSQTPQSGSLGLQANIPAPAPSTSPSIAIPSNGQTLSTQQISVSGICQNNLLVKIYSNNVFVGSASCSNNSYSLKIDLFNGSNSLTAQLFDSLGQSGPLSSSVNVNFNNLVSITNLDRVNLTSQYSELGSRPNQKMNWPIIISGGVPPYAVSVTWGDSSNSSLISQSTSGVFNISHTYTNSGVYQITISASDSKGSTGFLQVVGFAGSNKTLSQGSSNNTSTRFPVSQPNNLASNNISFSVMIASMVGLIVAFLLGSRHGKITTLNKYR